jgi:hypothetical protein
MSARASTGPNYREAIRQALTMVEGEPMARGLPLPNVAVTLAELSASVANMPRGWPGEWAGINVAPGLFIQASPIAAVLAGAGVKTVRVLRYGSVRGSWDVKA